MTNRRHHRPGYVFLVTILIIGVIASTTTISLLLLGWAAEQNGKVLVESMQAYEYAQTCLERALRSLRADATYVGNETFALSYGTCKLRPIGGSGNEDRTVCAEGTSGETTRRIQVKVAQIFPDTRITSWEEKPAFTLCP